MSGDIDKILDDIETTPVPEDDQSEAEAPVKAEAEDRQEPDDVETGDKADDDGPPPPTPDDDNAPHVPKQALIDERRKRQESEKVVAELQQQVAAFQRMQEAIARQHQAQSQAPPPPPDMFEDPEGYQRYQQGLLQQTVGQLQKQYNDGIVRTKVELSQEMMKSQVQDYDEMEQLFANHADSMAAKGDMSLWEQLYASPNPAKFAYEKAKQIKLMNEIGDDPQAYVDRLVNERLAQMNGQQPAPMKDVTPQAPPPPKSLAGTASVQPRNSKGQWSGPASISQLLDQ